MSVTTQIQIPSQPDVGAVTEIPLGGNGLIGPHSCNDVSVTSASDASGGVNEIIVHTDVRYACVFSFVQWQVTGASAVVPFRINLKGSAAVLGPSATGNSSYDATLGAFAAWDPSPYLGTSPALTSATADPMRMRLVIPNTNTEGLAVYLRVYNFMKDVQTRVPLGTIFSSLPRAGTQSP